LVEIFAAGVSGADDALKDAASEGAVGKSVKINSAAIGAGVGCPVIQPRPHGQARTIQRNPKPKLVTCIQILIDVLPCIVTVTEDAGRGAACKLCCRVGKIEEVNRAGIT